MNKEKEVKEVKKAPEKKPAIEEIKKVYVFKSNTIHNGVSFKRGEICDDSDPNYKKFKSERIIITYDEAVIAEAKRAKGSNSLSRKSAVAAQEAEAAKVEV